MTDATDLVPTGQTPPLKTSQDSRASAKHRAMVGFELEVLAKKFDRFGWNRDMGTPVHDRLITEWMDALQEFPLDEVRAACREAVLQNPNRMPNEGHVRAIILRRRAGPDWNMLSYSQKRMLERGECPPSMQGTDGEPTALAMAYLSEVAR